MNLTILIIIGLIVVLFIVYLLLHSNNNKQTSEENEINGIKVGDIYKLELISDNPFKEDIVSYVIVSDIKKNHKGETWVEYYYKTTPDFKKYRQADYFLETFVRVKDLEEYDE